MELNQDIFRKFLRLHSADIARDQDFCGKQIQGKKLILPRVKNTFTCTSRGDATGKKNL